MFNGTGINIFLYQFLFMFFICEINLSFQNQFQNEDFFIFAKYTLKICNKDRIFLKIFICLMVNIGSTKYESNKFPN